MRKLSVQCILPLLALLIQTPAAADGGGDSSNYFKEHFQFNGYLSLGYADLDIEGDRPLTGNEAILGIPEGGTASYGNAALLLRYSPQERHSFVLQLSGRELGDSAVSDAEDSIELDWLYYQFQLGENARLRVGRLPAPIGIFNEIRDVGVLLPFYRPSYVFYREGSVFSETVDGVGISYRFFEDTDWSLEADLYYGEFDVLEQTVGFDDGITELEAEDAVGAQLWLNTPVDSLRVGVGAQRWEVSEESRFNFEPTTWESWYFSVDYDFGRFIGRAEFRRLDTSAQGSPEAIPTDVLVDYYYLQLGYRVTDALSFYVQPEVGDIKQSNEIFVGGNSSFTEREDIGFSAVYRFKPTLVLKAEYHDVRSEILAAQRVVIGPAGPLLERDVEAFDSSYSIVSLAVSF